MYLVCLEALKVDWPMCNLHSIKSGETRVCKNVSSKNKGRCRDGAVCTCKYGKTTWRKNRRNKEEGRSMQRRGPVGPCNKEEGLSMQNPGH